MDRTDVRQWLEGAGLRIEPSPNRNGHSRVLAPDGRPIYSALSMRKHHVPTATLAAIRKRVREWGFELAHPTQTGT